MFPHCMLCCSVMFVYLIVLLLAIYLFCLSDSFTSPVLCSIIHDYLMCKSIIKPSPFIHVLAFIYPPCVACLCISSFPSGLTIFGSVHEPNKCVFLFYPCLLLSPAFGSLFLHYMTAETGSDIHPA